jgi:hypothetical protein
VEPPNSGAVFTGTLTRYPGETVDGGPYPILSGDLDAGPEFPITFIPADFAITKKPVTVTADPKTKIFRTPPDPDPPFTFTIDPALIRGDWLEGSLVRQPGEAPGTYAIKQGTLNGGSNYTMTYIPGNLTITGAAVKNITIAADPGQAKVYGDPDPVLTYSVVPPLDDGDYLTGLPDRIPGMNAGVYAITRGTLTAGNKYYISFVSSLFTISPARLIIEATEKTVPYGEMLPALTWTGHGFRNGDSLLLSPPEVSTAAGQNSDPGTYPISVCCANDPNYEISYLHGNLTITGMIPQPVIRWANPADIVYGTRLSAIELNAVADVPGRFHYDPAAGALPDAGRNQELTVRFLPDDSLRYKQQSAHAVIDVLSRPTTITANALSKKYGDADPALTFICDPPLLPGDEFTGTLARDAGENPGSYPVKLGTLTAGDNYTISFLPGLLTITGIKTNPGITWPEPAQIMYGTRLTSIQLNATAGTAGTFDYSPPAGTLLRAEPDQLLRVHFSPDDTSRFLPEDARIKITVGRKPIKVMPEAESRTYDGTTHARIRRFLLDGLVEGDTVTLTGGISAFDTPDAGSGKTVMVSGLQLSGSDAANYTIPSSLQTTAEIHPMIAPPAFSIMTETAGQPAGKITLTATIRGGAALNGGSPAATAVSYLLEGNEIRDPDSNSIFALAESGSDLMTVNIFTLKDLIGQMPVSSGLNTIAATFTGGNINYLVDPNPVTATFLYTPVFGIRIFPNPADGPDILFEVILRKSSRLTIDLFQSNGQLACRIFDDQVPGAVTERIRYRHGLSQGIYPWQVKADDQVIHGKLIVIRKY